MVIDQLPGGEPLWHVTNDLANLFKRLKRLEHEAASGSRDLPSVI
jgi:hypothetical protein